MALAGVISRVGRVRLPRHLLCFVSQRVPHFVSYEQTSSDQIIHVFVRNIGIAAFYRSETLSQHGTLVGQANYYVHTT